MKLNYIEAQKDNILENAVILDKNTSTQQFTSEAFYFLINGDLNCHIGETVSFTTSGGDISVEHEYSDIWPYNIPYDLITMTKGASLISVTPDAPSVVKVQKLVNSNVSLNTNDNAIIIVIGKDHKFNGNVNPMRVSSYHINSGTQTVSTEESCYIVHIEQK